jgi:RND superfamily putative drug exporter
VLLPAPMKRLGEWNWYLPKWLEWLPKFEIEGGAAHHDAPAAAHARPVPAASATPAGDTVA